jgi:uncharacterized protein DUF4271
MLILQTQPRNLVAKILFLFLSGLLVFCKLEAQTDTSRPAGVPDSASAVQPVAHHDSVTHHLSTRDSLRRDSLVRRRRVVRDSLRALTIAAHQDSVASAAAGVTRSGAAVPADSGGKKVEGIQREVTTTTHPVVTAGPPVLSWWQKNLAANADFNFTGKPVVESYEIHHPNSKDSLFYLIVGILFYFALIRVFFEKYFNNLMTLFFRVSLRQQQIREQVLQTPLPSLLLNILFIVSGGLYSCFLLHYSRIGEGVSFWVLYLYCMALLSVIYLVKFVVLKFVGWVFSISRATDIYIFVVYLVNKMMGIFLLPFLIIITFSGAQTREIFITISLAMVFVLWTYRALAAYRPVRSEIKLTPFYFFLYLCAFEIAPLILIYKVLLTYLEKVY